MRKCFAWIEVVFAVVLAIAAVYGYVTVKCNSATVLVNRLADTTRNYRQIAVDGKNIIEAAYQTVPHWRNALVSGKNGVSGVKKVCDNTDAAIPVPSWPEWAKNCCLSLKNIPQEFSRSCDSVNAGLQESIKILDSAMEQQKHEQTIQAFDKTISSLEAAEKSFTDIRTEISVHSRIVLIILLTLSVCFFANGMVCILESRSRLAGPARQ